MGFMRSRRLRVRLLGVVAVMAVPMLVATLVHLSGNAVSPSLGAVEEDENPGEPQEWMWLQRANADGSIPATAYQEALAQTRQIDNETSRGAPQLASVRWQLLGPSNIGGRLIDAVVDPTT